MEQEPLVQFEPEPWLTQVQVEPEPWYTQVQVKPGLGLTLELGPGKTLGEERMFNVSLVQVVQSTKLMLV